MISFLLAKSILKLFTMMAMGFAIVKLGILKPSDSKVLSVLAMYLINPCVIINAFQVDATPEVTSGLLLCTSAAVSLHIVFVLMAKVLGRHGFDVIERSSLAYTNAGNLIMPLVISVLGQDHVIYSVPFVAVQLCCLFTFCQDDFSGDHSFSIKKIFTNINIVSILLGLVLFITGLRIPGAVGQAVESVGDCIGPVCMLVTGMLMAGIDFKQVRNYKKLPLIVLVRMVVIPLVCTVILSYWPLTRFVDGGKGFLMITLMACCTQTASSVTQFAQVFDKQSDYASLINAVTTLCCIVTMPVCIGIYQML